MITKENMEELAFISQLPYRSMKSSHDLGLTYDAILDALQPYAPNIDEPIKYILTNHINLTKTLIDVVRKEYPDKLFLLEKLAILIQ